MSEELVGVTSLIEDVLDAQTWNFIAHFAKSSRMGQGLLFLFVLDMFSL